MDDIPWKYLLHRSPKNTDKRCEHKDSIYLFSDAKNQKRYLLCGKCNHKKSIDGIGNSNFFRNFTRMRSQPWSTERESLPADQPPIALNITDVNVHLPKTVSALDIPPESDIPDNSLRCRLQQDDRYEQLLRYYNEKQERLLNRRLKDIADKWRVNNHDLKQAFLELQNDKPNFDNDLHENIDDKTMRYKEFQAICNERTFEKHARFVTRHITSAWQQHVDSDRMSQIVEKLVVLEKLKEIQVFTGFNRYDTTAEYLDSRRLVGLCAQEFNFDPFLTIHQLLTLMQTIYAQQKLSD